MSRATGQSDAATTAPAPTPGLAGTRPTFTMPPDGLEPAVVGGPRPDEPPVGVTLHGQVPAAESLLRARLKAATGFLAITLGLLVVVRAFTGREGLLAVQALVAGALGAAYAVLSSATPLSDRAVRRLEFAVFALTSAYLSARQYQGIIAWLQRGDEALLLVAVKTTLISTILLIFAYCMFIPNRWGPALRVMLAIAAVPVATEIAIYVLHPGALNLVWQAVSLERVGEDVVLMLIAAGMSVYGTHVINALRVEAIEARLLNQYWLVQRLGTGGMGEVYLGEHRLLKRPCAVKLIRPATAADPIELARFEREVRATARLSHPNTVEVFDYGRTDDGMFYYVMEYLRGLSLEEIVKRHGPMPPGRVIYLLEQVCGALAEAHAAGLVHRDVKPANIYASYRGGRHDVAKLLDFGLVKGPALGTSSEPTDVVRTGMIRGTPLYMSPEQITGEQVLDHRADIYALGGVAYRLLTGSPPFERDTRREVLSAHASESVLPPTSHRPDIPADLECVVLKCLEKNPDDRYSDTERLAEALASCATAGSWDERTAAAWWHEHEPAAVAPPPSERPIPGA
jgi:tRNA A-37 threonylcarbamoyl transferase component Bud32